MKTLPTKVEYNQEDYAKLQDEFADKEELIASKNTELVRLKKIFSLMTEHSLINFSCQTAEPTQSHVDVNMAGVNIFLT